MCSGHMTLTLPTSTTGKKQTKIGKNKWYALSESRKFCFKPVAPCEVMVASFRFRDFSSSFLTANGSLFGRGSKCPGVGGGLLEKYGIFNA